MAHWQTSISKQPHLRQLLYHSLTDPFQSNHTSDSYCTTHWQIHFKATTPQTATVPLTDRSISKQPHLRQLLYCSLTDPFQSNHTSGSYCTAHWQIHIKATTPQAATVPLIDRSISKQPHLRQLLYHSLTDPYQSNHISDSYCTAHWQIHL